MSTDRTQTQILADVKAAVLREVPTATSIDVGTTDQHAGYSFVLHEVHTAGGKLSDIDPQRYGALEDLLFDDLYDLDWRGVVGEDKHGDATIVLRQGPRP